MSSIRTKGRDRATLRVRGWDGLSLGGGTPIATDPLGFKAGDTNLYRYVGNAPQDRTDPSGLFGQAIGAPSPRPNTSLPHFPGEVLYIIDSDDRGRADLTEEQKRLWDEYIRTHPDGVRPASGRTFCNSLRPRSWIEADRPDQVVNDATIVASGSQPSVIMIADHGTAFQGQQAGEGFLTDAQLSALASLIAPGGYLVLLGCDGAAQQPYLQDVVDNNPHLGGIYVSGTPVYWRSGQRPTGAWVIVTPR